MSKAPQGDFRETLYTIDKRGNRRWVYNTIVKGRFFWRRSIVTALLMIFYLTMPWVGMNGEQAVLFDIPGRRFVIFGSVFWATDTSFLVLVLGGLAISLFFFTALIGRVWCGWACPETVFLDFLFRPIERLIEGSPAERLKLDQSPWSFRKIILKSTKLFIFAVLAWILASTALAYFVGRETLFTMMTQAPSANPGPFGMTVALMAALLFQFGWFREQFCTVVCPYARFQSVLMDADSLTVGYDAKRGEPRGKMREAEEKHLGDCIDCGLCVRVCPTGIDIRNGNQLECVACASCVDACDSVMEKIQRPLGLIRYDTERRLGGSSSKFIRPRLIVYALILVIYAVVFSYRMTHREMLEAQMLRGAGDVPFTKMTDSRISNHLRLHLANKSRDLTTVKVSLIDETGSANLVVPVNPFPVPPESLQIVPVFVDFPVKSLHDGRLRVEFEYDGSDGFKKREKFTLLGPDIEEPDEEKEE